MKSEKTVFEENIKSHFSIWERLVKYQELPREELTAAELIHIRYLNNKDFVRKRWSNKKLFYFLNEKNRVTRLMIELYASVRTNETNTNIAKQHKQKDNYHVVKNEYRY